MLRAAHEALHKQLNWRGPNGRQQRILTLPREHAEAILNPTPLDGIDEIMRIARTLSKADILAAAEKLKAVPVAVDPTPAPGA